MCAKKKQFWDEIEIDQTQLLPEVDSGRGTTVVGSRDCNADWRNIPCSGLLLEVEVGG